MNKASLAYWVKRHPVKSQRALEIIPGVISWGLILFPIWGSFIIPDLVAYYIITFNVYWLYRSIQVAVLAIAAHYRMRASMVYDWLGDIKHLPHFEKVWHLVIIPTYKEPEATLVRSLNSLANQAFPPERIAVVLSFEEREGDAAKQKAAFLQKEFASKLGHVWATFHPDIDGEVKGKSSNMNWGSQYGKKMLIDKHGVDILYTTITSQDADAVMHKNHFAAVTLSFLKSDSPYRRFWQAGIMFYNNIWKVPSPIRALASIQSVIHLYVLNRGDRLINFSTYTLSLQLADEIGYWDTDVIPEDYRMFFKSYFATKGEVEVKPIYLPIYADAVEANSTLASLKSQYEQIKRWAWGTSDDAYIIKKWITEPGIPFGDKTFRVLHVIEAHFLWPVNWFAVTLGALIPTYLNPEFSRTILGKTLPQVSSAILTFALISLVVIVILDMLNRPPHPDGTSKMRRLFQPVEFLWMPIVGLFFSALPGLDAHTRLMMGRYIEYRVTEKV